MIRSCCWFWPRRSRDLLLWHDDLKRHATGEISIAAVQANRLLEDQAQVCASPHATYVGVYDGHGGPEASRFIRSHLFGHLKRFALEQGGLSEEVIRKAFKATEEDFVGLVAQSWRSQPKIAAVGSCCLVGAIARGVLYVANLGDSRAVLGRRDAGGRRIMAERLSDDHNVAEEKVRKELRLQHPEDSHIVVHTHGVWRLKGIIQVSRSIGDVYLKRPDLSKHPVFRQLVSPLLLARPVMSADPSIHVRRLDQRDLFLIFASDGLWEQLSDQEAVNIVFKNPRSGIARRLVRAALMEAARKREMRYEDLKKMEKGVRRHFHDDITVIVIFLDRHHSFSGDAIDFYTPVDIFSHASGR
ncbi:protein phosphatase 2C family protein isoform X2 [Wolffia australiana]